ncbi:Pyruvate kinase [Moorella thermoacetica]|uniref:pyruvate kinase n=1 Tax=Neomoorella thermoacetica TaxID=1525 RepID=UPI0011E84BB7|nr:pyruvate kinase [Moorella thermoacetica]TYL10772.1 Pyruvate kinase [Moorella thermoacetica]
MRHTKIVCTMGPASERVEVIKAMIRAGMNVAWFNFSHGSHAEHGARMAAVRQAAAELGARVALMLDNKGPEIRLGEIQGEVTLKDGDQVTLTTEPIIGDARRLPVSFAGLPGDVRPGQIILLDDGLVELEVLATTATEIHCRVRHGDVISSHKGVNVPGAEISLPPFTEQDIKDLEFGLQQGIDFIALSFVRTAGDVLAVRRELEKRNARVAIIAKIENHAGVNNIHEILEVADGVMVARGDLGVEIPVEEVPLVQKKIIEACNLAGKPVITATQMLESMIHNPRPTRAEASDVANAIFDGTDAIMLSGETATGRYPVEAVATMARIARRAERGLPYGDLLTKKGLAAERTATDAISHASCTIAYELEAAAIITPTASGSTARRVAKYRPRAPILATSPNEKVLNQLCLVWGVEPLLVEPTSGTDEMVNAAVAAAILSGRVKQGDLVVITAGVPAGVPGTTNLLKVHIVGEVLVRGRGIGKEVTSGPVRLVKTAADAVARVKKGDILVTTETGPEFLPAMERAAAVITETGGLSSHAAVTGLSLGIPVVVGAKGATEKLTDDLVVTIDVVRGLVYRGQTRVL